MLFIDNQLIPDDKFPDGTSAIRFTATKETATITWKYDNDAEALRLMYLVKHLRAHGTKHITLDMPYIPNARMDRVKNVDEVFTLKYFAEFINSLGFDKVYALDPHSNVTCALIDNIQPLGPNLSHINEIIEQVGKDNVVMYFPDEGAMKRYSDSVAKELGLPYVFGMKNRNWRTGKINGVSIQGDTDLLKNKTVIILDDICARGGTFYHSALALKPYEVKDIKLYVSHLENSVADGDMIAHPELISQIFTTDSIFRLCLPNVVVHKI